MYNNVHVAAIVIIYKLRQLDQAWELSHLHANASAKLVACQEKDILS